MFYIIHPHLNTPTHPYPSLGHQGQVPQSWESIIVISPFLASTGARKYLSRHRRPKQYGELANKAHTRPELFRTLSPGRPRWHRGRCWAGGADRRNPPKRNIKRLRDCSGVGTRSNSRDCPSVSSFRLTRPMLPIHRSYAYPTPSSTIRSHCRIEGGQSTILQEMTAPNTRNWNSSITPLESTSIPIGSAVAPLKMPTKCRRVVEPNLDGG